MNPPFRLPRFANLMATLGLTPPYIAGLDSGTTSVHATARFLHGKTLPSGGLLPAPFAPLIEAASYLPERVRESLYSWSGWLDAACPGRVKQIHDETISRWVVAQYPQRRYQAAMIGSANGAAVHLCAALGIPWLLQTLLMPMRRMLDPD